jgi:hypothetical protein
MTSDADVTSLRHEELVALVRQLRQRLAERDQEVEHLKRQLAERRAPSAPDESSRNPAPTAPAEPRPGSQEDLLAQLGKTYPEGG